MSDGIILQCARVDRLRAPVDNSTHASCVRCRQRVWLSGPAIEHARTTGIKPLCDVCQPAIDIGRITDPHGDGTATN